MLDKFYGTAVAIVTPFNKDFSIDFNSLEKLIEHFLKNGINYFIVLGTTGENATLNSDEKNQIFDFVVEKVAGRAAIVAGYGGNNTQEIISSIKKRNFKGIDAILSVAPYYNKPNQRGLLEHYNLIANNSPVPVVLYNVPGRTSVNISAKTTLELAKHKNIIAIKEASGDLGQIMEILKHKPEDFLVISGDDALTFPMMSLGAAGVISVVGMAEPRKMSDMVNYCLQNDFEKAKKLHYEILDLANAIFEDGNPAGIKAALKLQGLIKDYVRLPLVNVNSNT
ncbi:MAG: 4-hydroxy-tetrahydrodipicolinate synthase, partial [Bacteroidota bacterium]|nr:4-hydroxy-tetrahydrodipicolinate synthase [Bacteroidota bacterium]